MRIDKNDKIAGLKILDVRNAVRAQNREPFRAEDLAHSLRVSETKAREAIQELQTRGWLCTAEAWGFPDEFQTTLAGNAFTAASAGKPIPRAKADALLAEFLKRVEELNARDELTHYVHEVAVFGSYDGTSPEVGDIDLAVDLRQREIEGRDIVKYSLERAIASGKKLNTYIARLFYGERECLLILKARSPYISIHPVEDLKATGAAARVIYSWQNDQAAREPPKT